MWRCTGFTRRAGSRWLRRSPMLIPGLISKRRSTSGKGGIAARPSVSGARWASENRQGVEYRAVYADAFHGLTFRCAYEDGAAGAAAYRACHEFLQRGLTGNAVTA